ncbi:hypothetical protein Tco_1386190 [Tanacetum coccineum]
MSNQQERKLEYDERVRGFKSGMRRDKEKTFVIPEVTYTQIDKKGDERAKELGGFKRYVSIGDGNCSFRSYSQGIVGHQNLHKPFRMGTAAMELNNASLFSQMMLHPERYKPADMDLDDYLNYVKTVVSVDGKPVGMDVAQAAADLLQARMVRTYSTSPRLIGEMIPNEGPVLYEINLLNQPGLVDTLGRQHLYPYHHLDDD